MDLNQYPLVTVITPTYNRADYIEETMKSILSQNYPNLEYIVLDDGSSDRTVDILSAYSKQITWDFHPNMGETCTVNKGYRMARGQYIGVVNSDDILLPGAIQAVVNTFTENPDILVVYPDWSYIDEKSNLLHQEFSPEYNYDEMVRKHWCMVGPGAFIHRRVFELSALRDEKFKYVADFEYWLRLGLFGPFKHISGTYGTFRVHASSASIQMKNIEMAREHILLMKKYYAIPEVPTHLKSGRIIHEAWGRTYLHAARTCPQKSRDTKRFYFRSIVIYPPMLLEMIHDMIPKQMTWLKKLISHFR